MTQYMHFPHLEKISLYGYVWIYMGMYGYVWVCMGKYGYI